jgi:hypothetical protein
MRIILWAEIFYAIVDIWGMLLTTQPLLVPRSRKSGAILLPPPPPFWVFRSVTEYLYLVLSTYAPQSTLYNVLYAELNNLRFRLYLLLLHNTVKSSHIQRRILCPQNGCAFASSSVGFKCVFARERKYNLLTFDSKTVDFMIN